MTFINNDYPPHVRASERRAKPNLGVLPTQFDLLAAAMRFMRLVLDTEMTVFKPIKVKWGRMEFSEIGKMVPFLERFSELFASGYQFHPYLSFYFEEYRRHPVSGWRGDSLRVDVTGTRVAQDCDDFIAKLRSRAVEVKLRRRAANWEGKFVKNAKRLRRVESQMFAGCARILAVRLDCHREAVVLTPRQFEEHLAHQKRQQADDHQAFLDGVDLDVGGPPTGRAPFAVIQGDRARLFANMKGKPSLFKHLVAYVWRIEFTPAAGYHLHLALFFDGSKVQHHEWLAQQIGEYWRDVITQGGGWFHNCNRHWDQRDPRCGIGLVDHYDTRKRGALLNALDYLSKNRQQVLVLPYKGCNLFGAGLVNRGSKRSGGRPRVRAATEQLYAIQP